jgi:predicted TPR repeat methyltransferase
VWNQGEPLVTGGFKILDIGCGTGANLEMLSQFGEAEGVDKSSTMLLISCRLKGLNAQKAG